ncbi:hypothetical protein K431DRAFT_287050 [Polychaeton citri CBS 116435]|uniref:Uncharacterized protein n=1 Tax=Polychaeton citri CBS 116435 TaxID=1314669 RepID=A0A9P4UNN0_9PEZI|nr:hypothetical protein K431DRAFT_287050 [Polychaeton citri CBS 116435]
MGEAEQSGGGTSFHSPPAWAWMGADWRDRSCLLVSQSLFWLIINSCLWIRTGRDVLCSYDGYNNKNNTVG